MSTIEQFLSKLGRKGIRLEHETGRLKVHAPKGSMTPELTGSIRDRKAEILTFLEAIAQAKTHVEDVASRANPELSFAQQRLWFIDQLTNKDGVSTGTYNIFSTTQLTGALNAAALQKAISKLEKRHDILRANFSEEHGQPVQTIHAEPRVLLRLEDLSMKTEDEIHATIVALCDRGFVLADEPLLRMTLIRRSPQEHLLVLCMHHIISDGWSMAILVRELIAFYAKAVGWDETPLAPLPMQYADFAVWQRSPKIAEKLEQQAAWWEKKLAHLPALHQIPTDHPRPPMQTQNGATHRLPMDQATSQLLSALAKKSGATPFMVSLAAFQLLLAQYAYQDDIAVGTPIANRNRKDIEPLIGFFVNTLVLRTHVDQTQSFLALVDQVKHNTLAAYDHQDVPFEKVVDRIQPTRDNSHTPLFQIMFSLQNQQNSGFSTPGLSLVPKRVETQTAKFDLHLDIVRDEHATVSAWQFNTDIFDAATIEAMAENFHQLLKVVLENPAQKLLDLSIVVSSADHENRELHQEQPQYLLDQATHVHFEKQAAQHPSHVALILGGSGSSGDSGGSRAGDSGGSRAGDSGETMTYAELNRRANQWAWHLISHGVKPEDRLALIAQSSTELVIGLFAIFKVGAAAVLLDPHIPEQRLLQMLRDSDVRLALSQGNGPTALPDTPVLRLEDQPFDQSSENPNIRVALEQAAFLIYTSGSTGIPKASINTHRGLINHQLWMQQIAPMGPEDRTINKTTISFDAAMWECVLPLMVGAQLVLGKPGMESDTFALRQALVAHSVTHILFVPSVLRTLLDLQGAKPLKCNMRHIFCGGEQVQPQDHQRVLKLIENEDGPVHFYNAYGPSECAISCIGHDCGPVPHSAFPPIGKPYGNMNAFAVDPHLKQVPPGMPGELVLTGAGVSRGYQNRPGLTAMKFVPNPFEREHLGSRLYRTGDLVRRKTDHRLHFVSRIDHQVKLRGVRIELGEIEARLVNQPQVVQAAVVVNQSKKGGQRLIGYLVLEGKTDPALIAEIKNGLRKSLPVYMIPSILVSLEQLPKLPSGKVARLELANRPLNFDSGAGEKVFRKPETNLEKALAAIWADVLDLDRVGLDDNFFEIGGHSLLATQVVSRIREKQELEFPLEKMFSLQTLAQQAQWLQKHQIQTHLPLMTPAPGDRRRFELSFAQQRLWFIDQLTHTEAAPSGAYNISSVLKMKGSLATKDLQTALTLLEMRHELLRTQFEEIDGAPLQVIRKEPIFRLRVLDFAGIPEDDLQSWLQSSTNHGFALNKDPLLRLDIILRGETESLLVLTMHHIISDGWSMKILVQELIAFYEEAMGLGAASLPALDIQYADFGAWQRREEVAEELDRQARWWDGHLAGLPSLHQLPTDRPRPPQQTQNGAAYFYAIDPSTKAGLERLSSAAGTTVFMVVLTAFKVFLAKYSHQEDIAVGTPIANRNRKEVEPLIGFFVNTLVLRAQVDQTATFTELLAQVKQTTLESFDHQDVPFEKIVDLIQPIRDGSHTPLFQIMFSLQNQQNTRFSAPGLALVPVKMETHSAKFDLHLDLVLQDQGMNSAWLFNTDLFDVATIEAMAGTFHQLLRAIVKGADQKLSDLSLTDGKTTPVWVPDLHQAKPRYQLDQPAHVHFEKQAAIHPEHVALISSDPRASAASDPRASAVSDPQASAASVEMTYGELNRRANHWAWFLISQGVKPEDRVALIAQSSAELILGLIAIFKVGAAAVPLDANTPEQRLLQMLNDSDVKLALSQGNGPTDLPDTPVFRLENLPADLGNENPNIPVDLAQAAFLIYTSGSTGTPKASMNTHRGMLNHHLWVQQIAPMKPNDRMIHKATISFDLAMWECVLPLMVGAQLVLGKPAMEADPFALRQALEKHRVTHSFFVPSVLRAVLDLGNGKPLTCNMRHIFCGGEQVQPQDHQRVLELIENRDGPVHFYNGYGPSECAITCVGLPIQPELKQEYPPIGKPHGNMGAFVVDSYLKQVPSGMPGELVLAGVGLSRGYQNRPALTATKFVPNPFEGQEPGSRLYRTGDLVRHRADNNLHFVSRIDHQIKLRGVRIELGEIEATLAAQPEINQVAVVVNQSDTGEQRLIGYVVLEDEADLSLIGEIRARLSKSLPAYMVPSVLMPLDQIPQLPSGKIARLQLAKRAVSFGSREDEQAFREPETDLEKTLAAIWADVLDLDRVGLDDNFFEIGGHSLLATKVVSRIRDQQELELPLEKMFSLQTLAQQAEWLQNHQTQTLLPRMTPVPRDGRLLELSFAQQRLWFIDQLTRQDDIPSGAYNISSVLRMKGHLDIKSLQRALTHLEMRHEVLRTQFQEVDGAPFQKIRQEPAFHIRQHDFSCTSDEDLRDWIDSSTQLGFALDQDPLLRMDLLLRDEGEHILVLTMHHIISDGWSMNILVQELIATYSEAIGLGPASLPALDIQYADFGVWQRSEVVVAELDRQARWWEAHLAGLPALHQLPTDRPRPPHQTQNGAALAFQFDPTTTANLEKLANTAGATLFMVMLTAFKIFLAKYSGQKDIVVGTPIANRNHSQIEPLIGFFVNTLVLRDFMDSSQSFRSLLNHIKANTLQSYAHQDVPFEKLVDLLQPERQTSYPPLFQIMFSMQNLPATRVSLAELQIESMEADTVAAKFDLTLDARETPAGLATDWRFNTDLFDHETVQRMMASFKRLIDQILSNHDQSMAQLSLTSQEEWQYQVHALNQTQATLDYEKPMYAFFEEWTASHPQRLALTAWNGETWTYAELNRRANRIAWQLRELGIATDDRVAVFLQRSPEMIAALLGILKAGAAYVPIDPEYPEQRWAHMLEDSQASLLLTTTALATKLGEREHLCVDALLINNAEETNLNLPFSPDQAFFLIYTSGSSGKPKASVNRHRGMVNNVLWHQSIFPLKADDRVGLKTPFGFDVASWETFWPLIAGASLVIAKPGTSGDPFYLREWLIDHQVTSVYFVPSMLRAFLDSLEEPQFLSQLRFLFMGGEALPTETQQAVLERMAGPEGPLEIHNLYGPSEASLRSTYFSCGKEPRRGLMPIGRSLGNTKAYVVDAHGRMQPLGVPGELQVAGMHTSRGYLGKPALTAERFIPNAFAKQLRDNRIYRTGDLVRRQPHGDLLYLGRVDAQVKLRGMRLELGEIEAQISALEEVDFARVFLNAPSGNQHLVAFIQTQAEDKDAFFKQVRNTLAEELPAYMIPASMIAMDQWPLLPNGKINSAALQALAAENQAESTQQTYVPPRNELEETLCSIWQEVLGLERVGIHDPFFEIGGHSLLATQVVSRVRDRLAREFPLEKMFSLQTPAQQAQWLQEHQTQSSLPRITPVQRNEGALDLSFAQQRLWFIDQLTRQGDTPSGAYNMSSVLKMKGTVVVTALQNALSQLEMRHEVLRTQFEEVNGSPFQVIRQEPAFQLGVLDFTQASDRVVQKWIDSSTQLGFALEKDPLLRLDLLLRDEGEYVLVLTMHHIISDGWSMNILVQELIAFYSETIGLGPARLPALEIQYADFAVWQRSDQVVEELERQTRWWEAHLAGLPSLHQLPTDRPRPRHQSQHGAALTYLFDAATTAKLEKLAKASDATLFMVLLTTFKIFLAKYSGQKDIVVGTPIANRNRSQIEPLIGFFVNTLVLRDFIDPSENFHGLLDQIKANTLQSYAHQDVPFEKLVDLLQPARDTSYPPLFQIMFSMQNIPATRASLSGLEIESMASRPVAAMFELCLDARETPEGLTTQWSFNTDLFDPETIQRMMASFKRLVDQILGEPEQTMTHFSLTSKEDWDYQVRDLNQTQAALDYEKPMYAFLEEWAASHPNRLALTSWNDETWTYDELNRCANRIAWQLRDLGISTDDRVAIFMQRSPEMIAALIAILKAGAAYVPIDPEYPEQRWTYMLEDSQATLLLTTTALSPKLGQRQHLCIDSLLLNSSDEANLNLPFSPDQGFFLIYTSGTTGKPKASINRHRGIVNNVLWQQRVFPLTADDRVGLKTPFGFDVATTETFWPLVAGASIVIAKPGTSGDPFYLRQWLVAYQVTSVEFVPSMLRAILDSLETPQFNSHLRFLFSGGEALSPETQQAVLEKMTGPMGPLEIHNLYGPSEVSIGSTYFSCGKEPPRGIMPIGKAVSNTQTYVVDPHGKIQPLGVPGELQIAGVQTSRGYLGKAGLTAERFIPNPFAQHLNDNRIYRTGDLVRLLPKGDLLYLGRVDAQIKLRGMRLELGEIESRINALERVEFARVLLNAPSGNQHLVAFIQTQVEDRDAFFQSVRHALAEELPSYMVPASMVAMDQWPLLPNGKVDSRQLQVLAGKSLATTAQQTYAPPRNDLEETLCRIWQEVLGLERVGIHDSFFEIGGHSLLATQAVSRVRDQLALEFPLEKMFSLQTLAQQALWLQNHQTQTLLPPLKATPRHGRAPDLSFAQQRLWFIDQLTRREGAPSGAYNMSSVLKMKGTLSLSALQGALTQLEMRHEVLRTQFEAVDGAPRQVIRQKPVIQLGILDFTQASDEEVRHWIASSTRLGFALEQDPLLRLGLLLRDEDEYNLVLIMHHIISDGWSMNILVRELIAFYTEAMGLGSASLPALEIQYADFGAWQRSEQVVEELDRQANWWESHLAGLPALHQLPTDRPRPRHQTQNGAALTHQFDATISAELEALGKASGATLFMVLLTAFKIFLAKYSGQEDTVVGTPIANRNRSQMEPLIGFFINTLVLRDFIDPSQSFRSLLGQVKANTLQSYAHQDVPFEKLVDLLQPERQTSYPPLFQIMFSMQNIPATSVSLSGLHIESVESETVAAKFDLNLSAGETADGLAIQWSFNTDLFDRETIQRMMTAFGRLIDQILHEPDQAVARLSLTSKEEWDYQVCTLNQTQAELDYDKPMYAFIEAWAANQPERLALTSWNGDTWTYDQLNRRANCIAWQLRDLGISTDDRIGVFMQRSPEMIATLIAIIKAGAAYIPIDPEYPEQRWAHMLEDSQAPLLLTTTALAAKLGERDHLCVDHLLANPADETNLNLPFSPDQAFFLIYTSGTSGKPKASVNRHRGMVNYVCWHQKTFPLTAHDRVGLKTPFGFDVASWETFWPLTAGASLAIAKPGTSGDPFYLREWIVEHKVTSIYFVPSMLHAFLESLEDPQFVSPLRFLFTGGEALPTETQQAVLGKMAGPEGPLEIHNVYGPSEASLRSAYFSCGKEPRHGIMPIGKSLSNTKAYVVDAHGQIQPLGVAGELRVAGVHTSRGYLGKPGLTAERFIPNPFAQQLGDNRIYRTGDLVRRQPQGDLVYLGRVDAQVKLRGMRLELGEIEAQINAIDQVDFARAFLNRPSGDQHLVAFVQTSVEDKDSFFQQIRETLAEALPAYMVPSTFIAVDSWPLLPNGKINSRQLQAQAADSQATDRQGEYVPPGNDLEATLCGIWQEVLQVDRVGIHDPFFAIGGHSLLATQVVSRMRDRLNLEFPLKNMFSLQTVAQQAPWLQKHQTQTHLPPITPAQRDGQHLELSFAQQRLWFIDQLMQQEGLPSGVYNMSSVLKLQGTLAVKALQHALTRLEMRHEVLRTQFEEIDGTPFQVIRSQPAFQVRILDFSQRSSDNLHPWIQASTQRGFMLDRDPLLRMELFRLGAGEAILVLTMHHIISDGWSMDILVRELIAYYSETIGFGPAALPKLEVQYADFCAWQRSVAVVEELDRQTGWWESHLAGLPALHQLPIDRPRPRYQTQHGAALVFQLDAATSVGLEKLAQASGATLFMVLLTAFKVFLAKYSGQTDIVVGTPIANRNRSQVEPLIGFFINTLVLRDFIDPNSPFRTLLDQVKTNTLQSYAHQDVPFEKLVDLLQPERQTSYSPLFQIMFSMHNTPATQLSLRDLHIESLEADTVSAKFELSLNVRETPDGIATLWTYNTDLFDRETIERMAASFGQLMDQINCEPDKNVALLSLTSQEEQDYQLRNLSRSQARFDLEKPMYGFIEAWAANHPQRPALISWDGEVWTYDQLNRCANKIAWQLRDLGISTDDRVAVFMQRSPEMIAALIAILKAGAAYVPIDPDYPAQRWTHMLEDSQAPLLLTTTAQSPKLGARDHVCLDALLENSASDANLNLPFSPDQAFYLMYTSGSSGKPKASVNRHRGLVNNVLWHQSTFPLSAEDRVGLKTPFSFDAAAFETFWALSAGASLVLAKPRTAGDPFYLRDWLVAHCVTTLFFVPSMLRAFLDSLDGPFTCHLRLLFVGGEALPAETQQTVLAKLVGPDGPLEIINIYGPSEASVTSTYFPCGLKPRHGLIPIGKAIINAQTYVVDAQGRMQPRGVAGELQVSGDHTSRGYFGKPALTAERFIPNAFAQKLGENRVYRTGDLVRYLAQDDLVYLGRMDSQVKLRGMRLELGEIESHINALNQVDLARVFLNAPSGNQHLVAFIQTQVEDTDAFFKQVHNALAEELPTYMVPTSMIAMNPWPLLPNGKIDSAKLQQLAAESLATHSQRDYVPPRNDTEATLCQIWQQVLGLERVGIHDPFFEIGGHSLLATQVVSRIRDQLDLEFPLKNMFSLQTVAQQAPWLEKHQTRSALPPMTPVQRDGGGLALSFAQQRLWFIDQLIQKEGTPSGAYNISSVLKMKGQLAVKALQSALTQLEMRHEVLRTQFEERNGAPFQVFRQEPTLRLQLLDFTQSCEEEIRHWIHSATRLGFALDKDPLLRLSLLLCDEGECILVLTMHHIISDGWSMNILVRELIAYYSEAMGLGSAALPALKIQYADFAVWQRSEEVVADLDRQADWWQAHLAGLPALHQLPTDRPRPRHQTQNGAVLTHRFDATATAGLVDLGKTSGATLFMVLLTAFKIFLAKYSGQKDIVVGTPIANRNRSQIEPLIGFFVNTLVLRDFLDSSLSFRALLDQIKASTLQSYAHQDVPFEKLVDLLKPERQTSYPPLFQIMFSMQNIPATQVSLSDLQIESMASQTVVAKFDLTFHAQETPDGLAIQWSFNTDLFDRETVQGMLACFGRLVDQILSKPDETMAQLSLTSQEDWDYQVRDLNPTPGEFDCDKPMYAFMEQWALSHPKRLALTSWDGETWTYEQLNRSANRIAWQLRDLGIATDDRVAVFMQRSPEMIAALFAILKAGAAYIPIDPDYPEQRWTHMLEDSQAPLLLTTTALSPKLGTRDHVCLDTLLANNARETNLNLPFSPDQAFYLMYTSGSSGKPKASVNRHRGLVNNVLWHQSTFPLSAEDRVGLKTPFSFDAAAFETFWALSAGATLVLAKPGTAGDPFYLQDWLMEHRVTSLFFVPSMLRAFLDNLEGEQFTCHLRFLFVGGEALPAETQQTVLAKIVGPDGPLETINIYGPSEASVTSTYFPCGLKPRHGLIPIGKAISNAQTYVVDAHGRIQPRGVAGELQVAGVHTSRGYFGKPGLTAERFIPNPFAQKLDDNRAYRTGDLVRYLAQDDLVYLGRMDSQVKLRGMRLELGEIESKINALDQVDLARVFLNAPSGNQHLVAFIQTEVKDTDAFFKQVHHALAEELPTYMVPTSMIAMNPWPLLPNGKIDSAKLQKLAAESQGAHSKRDYAPPRNDIEETLCEIWQEVLGLERVGIQDTFFEIGGHSLLATQVLSRMRQAFPERLSLQYLFERPTIAHLSEGIQNIRKSLNQATISQDEPREEFEY